MPGPQADVDSVDCPCHHVSGDLPYSIRDVHSLSPVVRVRLHNSGELLQSPLDAAGSEVAQQPVGAEDGLGVVGPPRAHASATQARTAGTRRRIRTTMYPRIAPGMLLDRNAI